MIAFDTNVLVRLLVADDAKQTARVRVLKRFEVRAGGGRASRGGGWEPSR